jgi:putative RecB family exonuclease
MPVYSHSRLSAYVECPLKYKLCYRDKIRREHEGIEAFLGQMVHETLKKCYDNLRFTRANSLSDLLAYYNKIWDGNWRSSIFIVRQELTQENYRALGDKLIQTYYERYSPFDSDTTIGTEVSVSFALDDGNRYKMRGYIDRLSRTKDDIYDIHDYKTGAYLPSQQEADRDRQLGLYQIGVQKRWPAVKNVRLVWHYLASATELVSRRAPEAISSLVQDTKRLIDEIESAQDFPPRESGLCDWCEYPDLCPRRKHFFKVEALPVNEYLNEPGVILVNKYVELKEKASEIEDEMGKVREAIVGYAQREEVAVIKGSDGKATVRFDKRLKFPGKNEEERQQLDNTLAEAGRWMEVSQLDTAALGRVVENSLWDKELIDQVMKYGRIEETSSVHISRLTDQEK